MVNYWQILLVDLILILMKKTVVVMIKTVAICLVMFINLHGGVGIVNMVPFFLLFPLMDQKTDEWTDEQTFSAALLKGCFDFKKLFIKFMSHWCQSQILHSVNKGIGP